MTIMFPCFSTKNTVVLYTKFYQFMEKWLWNKKITFLVNIEMLKS